MPMIGEVCAYVRNYFLKDYKDPSKYIHKGHFVIYEGRIQNLPFLQTGQYFRIKGSVFNDGVHTYRSGLQQMIDENFDGQIWEMCVPEDFIDLCSEIEKWETANESTLASPYQSESFGGYSYTLRSGGGSGSSGYGAYGWQDQFARRLARYRRLNVI